jgi:hypothetical protein
MGALADMPGVDALAFALGAVVVLKGLNELLLLTLIAQGVLWLLAGPQRHRNLIYNAFNMVSVRIFAVVRRVTPSAVADRRIPFVATFWLLLIELALIIAKIALVFERQALPHQTL